MGGVGLEKEAF